ncbi:DCC1-like thiol-disulfide oxidoreductase family protein, partial [Akkermansiaceae bacterium]|nr:DCC1-like thiol-disulfide oxidoreductase family protein [Akkermansiaceae bacterium]
MNSQFALFRIFFGVFLTWHFIALIPYGSELFSNEGLISDPALNPTYGVFPNHLYFWDTPMAVIVTLWIAILASLSFTLGWARRTSAVVLWFMITALFHRNNLTSNPSLPYLGLILMLTTLIPVGENFSLSRKNDHWFMPRWIIPVASFLLALGYTFSGWTKLSSPSWVDGGAIAHLLTNPLARPGFFRDLLLAMPDGILGLLTWGALLAELCYLPLFLNKKSRPWIWVALLGMHLGLILLIDFADLSMGMIMIHFFTFNPKWLKAKTPARVAFDADCLMCNRFLAFLACEDEARLLTFEALPDDGEKTSMIVTREGRISRRSTAVIVILDSLGGHWKVLSLVARIIPRPIRDFLYDSVAKKRHYFGSNRSCMIPSAAVQERIIKTLSTLMIVLTVSSCAIIERPPGGTHLGTEVAAFREISGSQKSLLQNGDIVAFHMTKKEAMAYLKKGKIQKLPYQLFDYGHLALVVESNGEKKLLQLAMKQAANIDDGLEYLDDKKWV